MNTEPEPLDPHKTICVCYHKGRKVGSITATSPKASAYLQEMTSHYGELEVRYEADPTGGLLALLR